MTGVWRSLLEDTTSWALVIGGIGIALLSPSLELDRKTRPVWRWITTVPERRLDQLIRGVVLVLAGYAIVVWTGEVIEVAVSLVGVASLFVGVSALGGLAFKLRPREHLLGDALLPGAIVLTLAVTLVGVGAWFYDTAESRPPNAIVAGACNTKTALCNRPLDTVVFATTHNAMASADRASWFFPAQEANIAAQLRDGIRGFQIDAHYGHKVENRVLTVLHDESQARRTYEAVIGKEGVDAAFRIRDRMLGKPRGERRVYLCHGFCELGAVELVEVFRSMRAFLRDHPNEVLIVVIQDEDVHPDDIARAADESGLSDRIYRGPVTGPWPTLGEMIEQHQQVLIVAEKEAGNVPWYHPAFEVFQETPYDFRTVTSFSCEPWRGGTRGPLFQLNHWITRVPAPRPSDAELVNSYDFLMTRVDKCMRERHKIPNLLSVDFYRTGDLFKVVDELNQTGTPDREPRS